MSGYQLQSPCRVEDGLLIAQSQVSAFFEEAWWRLSWTDRTRESLIQSIADRSPKNLLTNREVRRHQKIIHLETGDIVGYARPRSAPSTSLTMEVGRPYDHRIAGHSGLYPKEPMPATHLLRLMDSSTSQGFTNYQRANRRQIELRTQNLSSQYAQHNHYNASPSTSHGSHLTEKVPLTLQDLARHQVEKNLHRPLRPHPRVGVLGSLLQQDIANWSESCGTQSGHRLGVSKGTTSFDMNRTGNYETLSSGMFSAGWNALQLGSGTSAANPEHPLPRYGVSQPWAGGTGKTPLDKLVRKDICQTNRNPADFTVISDKNEYMINL